MRKRSLFFMFGFVLVFGFIFLDSVSADSTVLYDDGTFIINEKDENRNVNIGNHGVVVKEYEPFNGSNYVFDETVSLWENEKPKIKRVLIDQVIKPKSISCWFKGCSMEDDLNMFNVKYIDLTNLDTSEVTDMSYMFYQIAGKSSSLEIKGLEGLDTSNVTNMRYMFAYIKNSDLSLNLDLSSWDVSKVTDMSHMFDNISLKSLSINIGGWDTSSVTNISSMFQSTDIIINGDLVIPSGCNVDHLFSISDKSSGNFVFMGDFIGNLSLSGATDEKARIGLFSGSDEALAKLNSLDIDVNSHIYINPYRIISNNAYGVLINDKSYDNNIASSSDVIKVESEKGYFIKSISVTRVDNNESVLFDYDNDTFVMPDSDVVVDVSYEKEPLVEEVNLDAPELFDYNNIRISWEEVSGADGYKVVLRSSDGEESEFFTGNLSYEFNNLKENYDYYSIFVYAYKDVDVDGNNKRFLSNYSAVYDLRTSKELEAPSVVARVTSVSSIDLSWNDITDAGGYNIYYKKSSSSDYELLVSTKDTNYSVSGLVSNCSYDFKVVPVSYYIALHNDSHSNSGYNSDFVFESKLFGEVTRAISLPDIGSIEIESVSYDSKRISWDKDSYGYKIYYKNCSDSEYTYLSTVTYGEYVFNKLPSSYNYDVKIVPYDIIDGTEIEGVSKIFTISSSGYSIGYATVTGVTSKTYNGMYQTQNIKLIHNGKRLYEGIDYEVSYKNNRNAGVATMTIKGIGNYDSYMTITYQIKPISISSVKLSNYVYSYNGYLKTPIVTVKNGYGNTLVKNTHYTVSYQNGRKNVGLYKVVIKGKGNYTGTIVKYFKIIPPSTSITNLSKGKNSIGVMWKKRIYQVSGYQICVSSSSKMSNSKYVSVSSYKVNKKTVKGLKKNRSYYVQVRTYKKTVNGTYYSGWSSIKRVVI